MKGEDINSSPSVQINLIRESEEESKQDQPVTDLVGSKIHPGRNQEECQDGYRHNSSKLITSLRDCEYTTSFFVCPPLFAKKCGIVICNNFSDFPHIINPYKSSIYEAHRMSKNDHSHFSLLYYMSVFRSSAVFHENDPPIFVKNV